MAESNNYITVTMTELKQLTSALYDANFPTLIRGAHGIGKSEFVYQLAAEKNMPVVELRASQMSEGDLTGLPFKGAEFILPIADRWGISQEAVDELEATIESTEFCPPAWFLEACARPVFLFFDEVDRAITEVRQGLFQINDSRRLNGFELHPETRIFAAVNGGVNAANYQVADMDPAELDRYTPVFDLKPTVDEWIAWAKKEKVYREIIAFINENPTHLEHNASDGAIEPGVVYPSRRSWKRLSDALQASGLFEDGINDNNASMAFMIASGFVGVIAAQKFRAFSMSYMRVVDPQKVLVEGDLEPVRSFTLPDMIDFCERIAKTNIFFRHNFNEDLANNTIKFFDIILNESNAIEAFQSLIEAMIASAANDESDNEPFRVVFDFWKHVAECESEEAIRMTNGINTSLLGEVVEDSEEYFKQK